MKLLSIALSSLLLSPVASDAWLFDRPTYGLTRPMVVYSPFESMLAKQQALVNRAFTQTSPRYEITNTKDKFMISVDVPGLKADDIHVSLEDDGNILTIAGSKEKTSDNYRFSSKFSQSFSLDPAIEVDKLTANLQDGVLVVEAPKDLKKVEEKIRKIPIMSSRQNEKNAESIEVKKSKGHSVTEGGAVATEETKKESEQIPVEHVVADESVKT